MTCAVKGCPVKRGTGEYSKTALFRFPTKDEERFRKFLDFVNLEELRLPGGRYLPLSVVRQKYRICERHFEKKYLARSGVGTRLTLIAVPTLNPPPDDIIPEPHIRATKNLPSLPPLALDDGSQHLQLPPELINENQQPQHPVLCSSPDASQKERKVSGLDLDALGNGKPPDRDPAACKRDYINQANLALDCKTPSQTWNACQPSYGLLDEFRRNVDVNVQNNADLEDVPERSRSPRSYRNVRTVQAFQGDVRVGVDTDSSQHVKLPSDKKDLVQAIDLPLPAAVDSQCISVVDAFYSPPGSPIPVDSDSSDSVISVHDSADGLKNPNPPVLRTSSLREQASATGYSDSATTVTAGAGACAGATELGATTSTTGAPHLGGDSSSRIAVSIRPNPPPVINVLDCPHTEVPSEACNLQSSSLKPNDVKNGTKPKRVFPSTRGQKSRISKGVPRSRIFRTHRNVLLYHRLNTSEKKCMELTRRLAKARKTIMILKKEKCPIMLKDG